MLKTILLIEDDLDIQRIYSIKLESLGYKVVLAADSSQAITILKKEIPALILLDIMLPGKMNGFELLKFLKEDDSLKNVPVVVLTNLDTEKDEALKMGASDYIVKANTTPSDIVEKVRKFIA